MAEHVALIEWKRSGPDFLAGKYSREHVWKFDGGIEIGASPAPSNVPVPWSNPKLVDPEEAFVASISSCHMLTFVWLASRKGFVADSYSDRAVGCMTKNASGVPWVSMVELHPVVTFSGTKRPTAAEIEELHHAAHEQCFIANSVRTDIKVVLDHV
jgi:organic hydroperoxide reductase OsmC/OhrA